MDEKRAREILSIEPDNSLYNSGNYGRGMIWPCKLPAEAADPNRVWLDGVFTVEQLEAIAWWVRTQTYPKPIITAMG